MGGIGSSAGVDEGGNLCPTGCSGYLDRMIHVCSNQVKLGYSENTGVFIDVNFWLQKVVVAYERDLSELEVQRWLTLFSLCNNRSDGGSTLR